MSTLSLFGSRCVPCVHATTCLHVTSHHLTNLQTYKLPSFARGVSQLPSSSTSPYKTFKLDRALSDSLAFRGLAQRF